MILLAVMVLLVAACGPEMATPTPQGAATAGDAPTAAAVGTTPTTAGEPVGAPTSAAELPVDPNDWHALGSADAAVTVIEYSDFQ